MEFALAANDAMGNVVAIAEDDCRPGFHCELLWREGEIIDVHLHVRRANGRCRNGGESGGDKKCAGAAPGAKSQIAGSFLSTVSTSGQRRIGDREGSFAAPDFDARYAQQTTQLFGWHEHRSWRGRGSRRGLREGRRHGTLLHGGFARRVLTSRRLRSCYSSEYRTPELVHPVEGLDGNCNFSRTTGIVAWFQSVADAPLVTA